MKIEFECFNCRVKFKRYAPPSAYIPKRRFCSKDCKHFFMKGKTLEELHGEDKALELKLKLRSQTGPNNPNFGNNWTKEQKEHLSAYKIKQYSEDPELRYSVGKSNRGKILTKERIEKLHGHRTKESYSRPMSENTKKLVGEKSKLKFTPEFKQKFRLTMESKGYWIPLKEKPLLDLYSTASNWICSMYDFVHVNNNINRKVRDHIIPRWVGFKYKVYPSIINHPLNCQIIEHSQNVSKGFSDRKLSEKHWEKHIKILINLILEYDKPWINQEEAEEDCKKYLNGNHFQLESLYEN